MRVYFLIILTCLAHTLNAQSDFLKYVNPFIGTGGHGHTFPGAVVPFGMMQLSPDTRIDGSWDGCSGYHYSDQFIYGFSHTHLSGTGCSDYGDVALLPLADSKYNKFYGNKIPPATDEDYLKHSEKFSHTNENASPGYYSVKLDNGVKAEFSATLHSGIHQYSWPANSPRILVIKLDHRDKTTASLINSQNNKTIEGFRKSSAWASDQHLYFSFNFSEEFEIINCKITGISISDCSNSNGMTPYVVLKFKKQKKSVPLVVRTGISQVDIDGARKNLASEIPHWDITITKKNAEIEWNKELSKIMVSSADNEKLTVFYTALYHCMIHPNIASDVDGRYRGRDLKIHSAKDFTYYTVFSIWDTFRGLHPLLSIIDRKRTLDFIKTFLAEYEQGGRLPVWELSSNETDCMIGYHSVSVITDAYEKGIQNFNEKLALEAMEKSANWNHNGIFQYISKSYLEIEDEHESVSKTLEYAYDDWCIGKFAELTRTNTSSGHYYVRSQAWKNLFDKNSNFIRPRKNGGWLQPFDPYEVNNNFTEANAWQYTFFVPHDITGLINYCGGQENFVNKLDELFNAKTQTTGREQADISGLIGQYAHGNEPSHHMAYLYDYCKQPWKTQELIHKIQNEFYKNKPDGLIGNEDCGQMSAWYVLSALGFYQVCPGNNQYALGTPAFETSKIRLENDKVFTIQANNFSAKNFYFGDVKKFFVNYDEIMKGETLCLTMSQTPVFSEADKAKLYPSSTVFGTAVPAPIISSLSQTFRDSMLITISGEKDHLINYQFTKTDCIADTCTLRDKKIKYEKPFYIKNSTNIYAQEINPVSNKPSSFSHAYYHLIPHNYSIQILSNYNSQYSAGGNEGIIDGLTGDENWRKGGWQGYQAQDFECIIDLKKEKKISKVSSRYLQDSRSWIFMPVKVEYYSSTNGKDWKLMEEIKNMEIKDTDQTVKIKSFDYSANKTSSTRYIKVKAINYGRLPKWHMGYGMNGDNAFIFIDEITIQ